MTSFIRAYSTRALKGATGSVFKSVTFKTPQSNPTMNSTTNSGSPSAPKQQQQQGGQNKDKQKPKGGRGGNPSGSTRLRGMDKDSPEVRISKTLSWLLRHGAQGEGLAMRPDGYVKVTDLLQHPKLKAQALDLEKIKEMVKADSKQRYDLVLESPEGAKLLVFGATSPEESKDVPVSAIWWIKARQGHSIKTVQLDLKPVTAVSDIPTGMAVHGTTRKAWELISKGGLSKMKRNHIHLAQNVANQSVVSGMRTSSQILIFIDVQKALNAGIKFSLSDNGVVLTEGDENGFLSKQFFEKVVDVKTGELIGWQDA